MSAQAQTASPNEITMAFAQAWGESDVDALDNLLLRSGVLVSLSGGRERMEPARALAALEQARAGSVGASVRVVRVEEVGGEPPQAFAELAWESVLAGTSEPIQRTVYVGFTREADRWWVREVRLLN